MTTASEATPVALPEGFAEDYGALRHGAAVVPLARDVLRVSGPDAVEYLQGQCSQDVAALAVGLSADALLLSPQGKLEALIRVTRSGQDEVYVDVDGGFGPVVAARLARFKLRVKAEITPLDWTCVAVRGPEAAQLVVGVGGSSGIPAAIAFSWGPMVGVDLLGPDPVAPAGVRMVGMEAWRSARVESGIPVMGAELDERTIAAEADLLERCVSFTKGCYTGQELVARLDARGNKVARRLRGIVLQTGAGGAVIPASGAEISIGDRVVGRVTSAAWSPALDSVVALGYLHRDVDPPTAVSVRVTDNADVPAEARVLPLVG